MNDYYDYDKTIRDLSNIILEWENVDMVEQLLNALLTPYELENLSKRWWLVKQLHNGKTQRDISKEIRVSLCKITRGSHELKKENSILKYLLEKKDNV